MYISSIIATFKHCYLTYCGQKIPELWSGSRSVSGRLVKFTDGAGFATLDGQIIPHTERFEEIFYASEVRAQAFYPDDTLDFRNISARRIRQMCRLALRRDWSYGLPRDIPSIKPVSGEISYPKYDLSLNELLSMTDQDDLPSYLARRTSNNGMGLGLDRYCSFRPWLRHEADFLRQIKIIDDIYTSLAERIAVLSPIKLGKSGITCQISGRCQRWIDIFNEDKKRIGHLEFSINTDAKRNPILLVDEIQVEHEFWSWPAKKRHLYDHWPKYLLHLISDIGLEIGLAGIYVVSPEQKAATLPFYEKPRMNKKGLIGVINQYYGRPDSSYNQEDARLFFWADDPEYGRTIHWVQGNFWTKHFETTPQNK